MVEQRQHSYRRKMLEESFRSVGVSKEKNPCLAGFFLPLRFFRLPDERERFGLAAVGSRIDAVFHPVASALHDDRFCVVERAFSICYEASTGYGPVHDALVKIARRVVVAHAGHLRLIFRSKQKNDRVDVNVKAS